jgi:hypothetical protein
MAARISTKRCASRTRTAVLSKPYDIAQLQAAIQAIVRDLARGTIPVCDACPDDAFFPRVRMTSLRIITRLTTPARVSDQKAPG